MTVIQKTIGRLPVNLGDYDSNRAYGKKNRCFQYGCEVESKVENNTYPPFSWDGAETFVLDDVHWLLVSGNPEVWAAGNPKPATSEQHPYNGMGRVVLKKNIVNGVNTLTQDMFYKGEVGSRVPNTNTIFVIQYDFELAENTTIPDNCVLEFDGGKIGGDHSFVGTNTKIIAKNNVIFGNDINVSGTWDCSYITTDWFEDVHGINKLKNVFALSADNVQNTIIINPGTYYIQQAVFGDTPFVPKSNTKIILNGTIEEVPNSIDEDYFTVDISGVRNVSIEGNGTIKGDKSSHSGSVTGEKGHVIAISGSRNITIKDITVKDAWGDCIYIGTDADNYNIKIDGCTIDNGRRQGISVVNAIGYEITNCIITNISGTPPEYGIDIEPNAVGSHQCWNGIISNCRFITKYGIYIQNHSNQNTRNLVIDNNYFDSQIAISVSGGINIEISNNYIKATTTGINIVKYEDIELSTVIKDNTVYSIEGGSIGCSGSGDIAKDVQILNNILYGWFNIQNTCEDINIQDNKFYIIHATIFGKNCIVANNLFDCGLEVNNSIVINNISNDYIYNSNCIVKNNKILFGTLHESRYYSPLVSNGSTVEGNIITFTDEVDSGINEIFNCQDNPCNIINNKVLNAPRLYAANISADTNGVHIFENNEFAYDTSIYNYDNIKDKVKFVSHCFPAITRPISLSAHFEGVLFYDRTLGKPLWWTTSGWKDANGNNPDSVVITKSGTLVSGNVPEFDGTDGAVKDSGKAATSIP